MNSGAKDRAISQTERTAMHTKLDVRPWWKNRRAELQERAARVFALMEEQGPMNVGFMARAYFDEFVCGTYHLIDVLGVVPESVLQSLAACRSTAAVVELTDLNPTARRLCQL